MSSSNWLVLTAEQNAEQNARMRRNLGDDYQDVFSDLHPFVRKRVRALRAIQLDHHQLNDKYSEEKAALEAKYQEMWKPLYNKRYDIVNGLVEMEKVIELSAKNVEEAAQVPKGIPNFWVSSMKKNDILSKWIKEEDEEALKHLKDIRWCRLDDLTSFKIDFFFGENPYFKNDVLSKTYKLDDDGFFINQASGTVIEWHNEKYCLTKNESFFKFFDHQFPTEDELMRQDLKMDENLLTAMKNDFEIGMIIREKIIHNCVEWFTEEILTGDFEDTDDGDSDDESFSLDEYESSDEEYEELYEEFEESDEDLEMKDVVDIIDIVDYYDAADKLDI